MPFLIPPALAPKLRPTIQMPRPTPTWTPVLPRSRKSLKSTRPSPEFIVLATHVANRKLVAMAPKTRRVDDVDRSASSVSLRNRPKTLPLPLPTATMPMQVPIAFALSRPKCRACRASSRSLSLQSKPTPMPCLRRPSSKQRLTILPARRPLPYPPPSPREPRGRTSILRRILITCPSSNSLMDRTRKPISAPSKPSRRQEKRCRDILPMAALARISNALLTTIRHVHLAATPARFQPIRQ